MPVTSRVVVSEIEEMDAIVSARVTLDYPEGATEVFPSDVFVVIKVSGYKPTQSTPASELSDEFWDSLPQPLQRKTFEMQVREGDWETAFEYEKYVPINSIPADFDRIYAALKPLGYSEAQIDMGWKRFCQADQRSEYVCPEAEAHECRNEMINDYIENSLGVELTGDAISLQVAAETGLEAVNLQGEGWVFPKFIDGGDGVGCRVVWGN
jgi:hypothetical protein